MNPEFTGIPLNPEHKFPVGYQICGRGSVHVTSFFAATGFIQLKNRLRLTSHNWIQTEAVCRRVFFLVNFLLYASSQMPIDV